MKHLLVALTAALGASSVSAQPEVPPGAKGNPPFVTRSLPKLPGADKPVVSVQGGVRTRTKAERAAPTEELKFNPPKR